MAHILAKLKNVKFKDVKKMLEADAKVHAQNGFFLEHVWENTDNKSEVLFLFKTDDINKAKEIVQQTHLDTLKENPNAQLPEMTFLEGK